MTNRAVLWDRRIAQWQRSCLAQAAFCQQHGLSVSTFQYWRRRLRNNAVPSRHRAAFIPVHVKDGGAAGEPGLPSGLNSSSGSAVPGAWACEIIGPQGVQVRLRERPSLARLGELMAWLAGASQ
jgi:hypothetical protein